MHIYIYIYISHNTRLGSALCSRATKADQRRPWPIGSVGSNYTWLVSSRVVAVVAVVVVVVVILVIVIHMAHFQSGSFLIGLVSKWAPF